MDARPLLAKWLDEKDHEALGQAIVNAYLACNSFMSQNIVFSEFAIGIDHRSHLLRIFVEHALNSIPDIRPAFFQEIRPNVAKNCWHLRLHKSGLVLTSHFMGRHKYRKMARPAKNRAILANRNYDLFADVGADIDICNDKGVAYCHILHGGKSSPDLSMLAIPTRDQSSIAASCHLPKPEPQQVKSEEITDEVVMRLRRQANELKEQGGIE